MELIVLIFLSIGPAVVWYGTSNATIVRNLEPTGMLARAFVAGLLAVIPAGIIEVPLAQYWGQVLSPGARLWLMVLGVGLIEELAKFLAVYFTVYKSSHFDGPPRRNYLYHHRRLWICRRGKLPLHLFLWLGNRPLASDNY